MAIDKLFYFSTVVESKSLRKAAEIAGITPGSMSKAISTLEVELGVKLLRPEGRGIEITDKGMKVYKKATLVLMEYKRFLDSLHNEKQSEEKLIRLGSFEIFSTYFLSSFLNKEFLDHPALTLELSPGMIETAIVEGLIDYGITYLPCANENLEFTEIGQIEISIWGLSKWQSIDYKKWPFAIPVTQLNIHSLNYNSLDLWPMEVQRSILYKFHQFETAIQTTRLGNSVIYCPDFIAKLQNHFVKSEFKLVKLQHSFWKKNKKTLKVFLVSKKGISIRPIEGKLAKFLRSL